MVWQCKLVSGWGLRKGWKSAPPYGPCSSRRTLRFCVHVCLSACMCMHIHLYVYGSCRARPSPVLMLLLVQPPLPYRYHMLRSSNVLYVYHGLECVIRDVLYSRRCWSVLVSWLWSIMCSAWDVRVINRCETRFNCRTCLEWCGGRL